MTDNSTKIPDGQTAWQSKWRIDGRSAFHPSGLHASAPYFDIDTDDKWSNNGTAAWWNRRQKKSKCSCSTYLFLRPICLFLRLENAYTLQSRVRRFVCGCVKNLPGPAWPLLSKTCKPFFSPLYYLLCTLPTCLWVHSKPICVVWHALRRLRLI